MEVSYAKGITLSQGPILQISFPLFYNCRNVNLGAMGDVKSTVKLKTHEVFYIIKIGLHI